MPTSQSKSRVAITGVGSTPIGVFPDEDSYSLGSTAFRNAMREAGVSPAGIDGLIVCRVPDYQRFAEIHGLNPQFALNLPGQGRMAAISLQIACQAIESGAATTVALVYGNDGRSAGMKYGGDADSYGGGAAGIGFPYGMTSPGAAHAMMFRRYAHLYGSAEDALAKIAWSTRQNASLNPGAVMRKTYTLDEYYASKYIAAPLRLFDYCLINDGGIALIVTRADQTAKSGLAPVYVAGIATATQLEGSVYPPDDFWYSGMQRIVASLKTQTGLTPKDMDGLMIYDNFTPTVLFSLEGFGVCGLGEAADYVRAKDFTVKGKCPVNTSGGHLSESYMQGWGMFTEAVRQIRGECGERQIKGARHIEYMCAAPISSAVYFSSEAS